MDTDVSLCNTGNKRSDQQLVNMHYNGLWFINNGMKYGQTFNQTFKLLLWYCILWHLLHWRNAYPTYAWANYGVSSCWMRIIIALIWLPAIVPALMYKRKH